MRWHRRARSPRIPGASRRRPRTFDLLEGRVLMAGNLEVVDEKPGQLVYYLQQYTQGGALVSSMTIPRPTGQTEYQQSRGVTVDSAGNIDLTDGSSQPYLSTFSPSTGTWSYQNYPGWSLIGNVSYGSVGALGNYVYAANTTGSAGGIIRFNITNGSATAFAPGHLFIQLTVGLDGLIYGLGSGTGSQRQVFVYDSQTMSLVRTITLPSAGTSDNDYRAIAVDAAGEVIAATWTGNVIKLDPTGTTVLASTHIGDENIMSVALDSDGQLAFGGSNGDVYLTDESLSSYQTIATGEWYAFVTFNHYIAPPTLDDAGFETPSLGGGYAYDPNGSGWTFQGGAGITGNGNGFTAGNPDAPERTQVGFLQGNGSFSQVVNGWAAGSYTISFDAAQRGNSQASQQDFQVLVDGVPVGTFTPAGTAYENDTTAEFSVAAGSHTITFLGLDSAGGDNTAFIDNVDLVQIPRPPQVSDAGFETPSLGGGYAYDPNGSGWTFQGGAGITGNGNGFTAGNPAAPGGVQVAFLQGAGSFSQVVNGWAAGSYRVTFQAAQRGNSQASQQDFQVLVDGKVVGVFTPSGTSYATYTTDAFTIGAGSHIIAFQGLDSAGGDNTAFIDNVQIAAVQGTPLVGDTGFESPSVGTGSSGDFLYDPTGTPWIFSGVAGVAGDGSGFTAGNPDAPEGTQVAFLQETGSFSQVVNGWAAGSYTISFDAAQRGNSQASQQDFQVLVDGVPVGTFTPAGTAYENDTTAEFSVAAGSHTITFLGLDSAGGDNTAFIDAITVTMA